jgi:hypothetical protein
VSAAATRLEHWASELIELRETADTIAAQLDRTRGILKCLARDRAGVRDALTADLDAIASTSRRARDALARLRAEIDQHAQLRSSLKLFTCTQSDAPRAPWPPTFKVELSC